METGDGMTKLGYLAQVQARSEVAFRCGFSAWHPEGSIELARVQITDAPASWLDVVERSAFTAMSPGPWWAAFARGWDAAAGQAAAAIEPYRE